MAQFKPVEFKFYTTKVQFGTLSKTKTKSIKEDKDEFYVQGYASTFDLDRQDEIVTKVALQEAEDDLLENSTVFFGHDYNKPIGKVTKTQLDDNGLFIEAYISKTLPNIRTLIEEGILNRFSIGGRVSEIEPATQLGKEATQILKLELYEVSLVGMPANSNAKVTDYIRKALEEVTEIKLENSKEESVSKKNPKQTETKKVFTKETKEELDPVVDNKEIAVEEEAKVEKEELPEDLVIKTTEEDIDLAKTVTEKLDTILKMLEDEVAYERPKPTLYLSTADYSKVDKMEVGDSMRMEISGKVKYLSEDEDSKFVSIELDNIEFMAKKIEVIDKKGTVPEEIAPEEEKIEPKVVAGEKKEKRKGIVTPEKEDDEEKTLKSKLAGKTLKDILNDTELYQSLSQEIQIEVKNAYKKGIVHY